MCLLALLAGGELCVCNLMTVLVLPRSTISRHLRFIGVKAKGEQRYRKRLVPKISPLTICARGLSGGAEKHGMNPDAVRVMAEVGVDISGQYLKIIDELSVRSSMW